MEEMQLTPKETKEAIGFFFERMPELPILLCGPSGIGKTDISRQIAHERNWDYLDIRLAGMLPEDLRGYPKSESWVDVKARKELGVGGSLFPELKFVLIDKLNTIFETEGPGLLDFEEINRAHPDVHQPIFQLIGDRAMDDRQIGKHWRIIASINPDSDSQYIVNAMDMAFTRRWLFINVKPDLGAWMEYAESKQFHSVVLRFLKMNPDMLYRGVSEHITLMPAVWERVSDYLYCFVTKAELSKHGLKGLQLLIGQSAGNELYTLALKDFKEDLYAEDIVLQYFEDKGLQKKVHRMIKAGELSELSKVAHGVATLMESWDRNVVKFVLDIPNDVAQVFENAFGEKMVDQSDVEVIQTMGRLYAKMNQVKMLQ
ncbi:MAG TPA: AAA family ATPase [Thermotogota bacterium]|nr:AAA family ATPase [Thermotogota bacterium]